MQRIAKIVYFNIQQRIQAFNDNKLWTIVIFKR